MKKILSEKNKDKNVIVEVFLWGGDDKKYKREKYKCVGVLMKEEENKIKIAFNAVSNKVKDSLTIDRKDIISIKIVDEKKINLLE